MKRSLVLVLFAACSKTPEKAPPSLVKLPKVGLVIDAPSAVVKDSIAGNGNEVVSTTIGALMIDADLAPLTADQVKTKVESSKPVNVKVEDLSDGFVVTYELPGDKITFFNIEVHRKIGDSSYTCKGTSTASTHASREPAVLAACKSLAKG